MTAFAFKHSSSTVDFIRQLKEAKFTDNQIQVLAKHSEEQTQQIEHVLEGKELSSKNDLELVRLSLQNDIKVAVIKLMAMYGAGFLIILGILAKGFHWI